ncbi:helix-turn-helix domain-containing protein [Actinokineospora sp.]|uniref:helix-turn-helix domain-containing protein n=1 Tax=Actinokineospora sp. TaxID=1872133 RepID=UPI0040384F64
MPRRAGLSVRSRRIAFELRKLRVASGMSCAELAKSVDMSGSKVSRFETCESGIYFDDVEKLLDFFDVGAERRAFLLDLARHAAQRGWLRVHGAQLPDDWQTWIDLEAEASALFSYQPLMIPGLLQSTEYARAIIRATGPALSDDQVDLLISSRMSRQGLLSRSRPLRLDAIIEEGVLTRPIGDAEALARQLRNLADSAARPNVTVRVLPTAAGLHSGLYGPFVIMDYDDEASLVLLENKVSNLLLDEQEHIDAYSRSWDGLAKLALDEDESIEVIRSAARTVSAL